MKRLILSMTIIAGLSAMAFAQDKKTSGKKAYKIEACKDADKWEACEHYCTSRVNKKGRNADNYHQTCDFENLNLTDAQKEQLKTVRKSHQEKMVELKKSKFAEMKAILTPEQATKLESSRKDKRQDKRAECTVRFDAATEAKLKELNIELSQKAAAIKKTRIAPEMMNQKLRELNEEYSAKRSKVIEESIPK